MFINIIYVYYIGINNQCVCICIPVFDIFVYQSFLLFLSDEFRNQIGGKLILEKLFVSYIDARFTDCILPVRN